MLVSEDNDTPEAAETISLFLHKEFFTILSDDNLSTTFIKSRRDEFLAELSKKFIALQTPERKLVYLFDEKPTTVIKKEPFAIFTDIQKELIPEKKTVVEKNLNITIEELRKKSEREVLIIFGKNYMANLDA